MTDQRDYSGEFRRLQQNIERVGANLERAQRQIEAGIRSELGPAVRLVAQSLTEVKTTLLDLGGGMSRLAHISEEGFDQLNQAVNGVTQSAGETEVLIRTANVNALQAQIEVLQGSLSELRKQIRASTDKLKERYAGLLEGEHERKEERLEGLDRHILDLVRAEFQEQVERRQQRFSAFDRLARLHLAETLHNRRGLLDEGLEHELRAISEFARAQQAYVQRYGELVDEPAEGEDATFAIPRVIVQHQADEHRTSSASILTLTGDADAPTISHVGSESAELESAVTRACCDAATAAVSEDVRHRALELVEAWAGKEELGASELEAIRRAVEETPIERMSWTGGVNE